MHPEQNLPDPPLIHVDAGCPMAEAGHNLSFPGELRRAGMPQNLPFTLVNLYCRDRLKITVPGRNANGENAGHSQRSNLPAYEAFPQVRWNDGLAGAH